MNPPDKAPVDLRALASLLTRPIDLFVQVASSGGVLLVVALIVALTWRNAPDPAWAASYEALWSRACHVGPVTGGVTLSVRGWINDAAMAVFFLVVGAEIKREMVVGELAGFRRAIVPALAALGGMLVPALLYLVIAPAQPRGFGTPMATDIAFSLAAIRVAGARVPDFVVKVLMGLAILDDLGAIVVIALFYGGQLHVVPLVVAAVCCGALVALNVAGVVRVVPYLVVGVPLWLALHAGGLHPTLAGVAVGMALPARGMFSIDDVVAQAQQLVRWAADRSDDVSAEDALRALERRIEEHEAPLERLVRPLQPWVQWGVLPVFALANAGIPLHGLSSSTLLSPVALAVTAGLFVGKQAGIFGAVWASVRAGLLPLPAGVRLRHVWGMAILGGIGFTMSLFVAALAFEEGSVLHDQARVGVLVGSTLSAIVGVLVLRASSVTSASSVSSAASTMAEPAP